MNLLGLSIPIAAQLVFNRILPVPEASTLPTIVVGVVIFGAIEASLRLLRSIILQEERRMFTAQVTKQLMKRIISSDFEAGERGAARSLDYFQRIGQVGDKYTGQSLVAIAELFFLPIIIGLMMYIAPVAGFLVLLCLIVGTAFTLRDAHRLQKCAVVLNKRTERRYQFLLMILHAIHPLKALAMEQQVLRSYESIQADIARTSLMAGNAAGRMMNGMVTTNQVVVAVCLIYGAFAVNQGEITLGAVSAIVLLGGRLAAPIQRAVFIFMQSRDLCQAEIVLKKAFELQPRRQKVEKLQVNNIGKLQADGLSFSVGSGRTEEIYDDIELDVVPGETVGIAAKNGAAIARFFRILAGVEDPLSGTVRLNDQPVEDYCQDELNNCVAYVSGNAPMFYGTIRDNITRFGSITLDEAMSVAHIMGIDDLIKELPRGIDTELTGMSDENIPAGLCQQLAMLRAVVLRPKLMLLDNADRGLDRASYGRLQSFLAKIEGQATILMASEDRNLTSNCRRRLTLTPTGLQIEASLAREHLVPYRSLKL